MPLQRACDIAAAAGDNTLIPAPGAGKTIVIKAFSIQNESANATTFVLRSGGGATLARHLLQNQGDDFGALLQNNDEREWLPCDTNEALVLNLSGANAHGYLVWYRILGE